MKTIQITDRYSATGTPYPDPETMCKGHCEGMGCYPHKSKTFRNRLFVEQLQLNEPEESDIIEEREWKKLHRRQIWKTLGLHYFTCRGWHFITCPTCHGSRLNNK